MDISRKIVEHLTNKKDGRTDLNGILIAMYEEEIKILPDKVLKTLADLKYRGIVKEYFDEEGRLYYKLLNTD